MTSWVKSVLGDSVDELMNEGETVGKWMLFRRQPDALYVVKVQSQSWSTIRLGEWMKLM